MLTGSRLDECEAATLEAQAQVEASTIPSTFWDLEHNQISVMAAQLQIRKEKHLRRKGWEHTSDTIDHCWRWFKEINGRSYGCGLEEAFKIQSMADAREFASLSPPSSSSPSSPAKTVCLSYHSRVLNGFCQNCNMPKSYHVLPRD